MKEIRREMRIARYGYLLGIVWLGLWAVVLVGCQSKEPDEETVHALIEKELFARLEPHVGVVSVVIDRYTLGEPVTEADGAGVNRESLACKAIYETTDARGRVNRDRTWVGRLTTDENGEWIAIPQKRAFKE